MAKFQIAFKKTMVHEGGYVNDPADRGGETYKGISRKYHPEWPGWKKVEDLYGAGITSKHFEDDIELQNLVQTFYKEKYWLPLHIDSIPNQNVADKIFDIAVNMGTRVAQKLTQEGVNLINRNGQDTLDVMVDGVIGEKTLFGLKAVLIVRLDAMLLVLKALQAERYVDICRRDPTQEKFLHGWLRRVFV